MKRRTRIAADGSVVDVDMDDDIPDMEVATEIATIAWCKVILSKKWLTEDPFPNQMTKWAWYERAAWDKRNPGIPWEGQTVIGERKQKEVWLLTVSTR